MTCVRLLRTMSHQLRSRPVAVRAVCLEVTRCREHTETLWGRCARRPQPSQPPTPPKARLAAGLSVRPLQATCPRRQHPSVDIMYAWNRFEG